MVARQYAYAREHLEQRQHAGDARPGEQPVRNAQRGPSSA
jgi:hypothetical protein